MTAKMSCRKKEARYFLENFEDFSIKIPWDCFVYILTNFLDFEVINKSGSKRLFVNGIIRFSADETHNKGDSYVFKYDRIRAIGELKKMGVFEEKGGDSNAKKS